MSRRTNCLKYKALYQTDKFIERRNSFLTELLTKSALGKCRRIVMALFISLWILKRFCVGICFWEIGEDCIVFIDKMSMTQQGTWTVEYFDNIHPWNICVVCAKRLYIFKLSNATNFFILQNWYLLLYYEYMHDVKKVVVSFDYIQL